ncbi:MAG: 4-methyl-5-nitrocatechol 5-monooxygenase [Chlamydiae bacterium]|nr:4-methyl-5-nitrocatechol 5-monooxygenase [Chlamydiota bacterium]
MFKSLFLALLLIPITLFATVDNIIETDVLVIGGGPVGTFASNELGALKIPNIVLEKHTEILDFHPRAQSINARSMQMLARHNLSEPLRKEAYLSDEYYMGVLMADSLATNEALREFPFDAALNKSFSNISPEGELRIPLWKTEALLRKNLENSKYSNYFKGYEAVDIEDFGSHVKVTAFKDKSHEPLIIKARYVLGCDGANSKTRELMEIQMQPIDMEIPMLNVVYKSELLQEQIQLKKACLYYLLGQGTPAATGPIDQEGLWYAQFFFPENENISFHEVKQKIKKLTGLEFDCTIVNAYIWQMKSEICETYQKGNVFLVGDAAHIMYPTGGLGMNTGFQDAQNIAWKLASVLRGTSGSNLLKTYETERRPIAEQNMLASSINMRRTLKISDTHLESQMPKLPHSIEAETRSNLENEFGYRYQDSAIIKVKNKTKLFQKKDYTPLAQAGYFAPHIWLKEKLSIYEKLGFTFTLLVPDTIDKATLEQLEATADQAEVPLNILKLTEKQRAGIYPAYTLIRPDWHIAWSDNALEANFTEILESSLAK